MSGGVTSPLQSLLGHNELTDVRSFQGTKKIRAHLNAGFSLALSKRFHRADISLSSHDDGNFPFSKGFFLLVFRIPDDRQNPEIL
jgi:hypothetical protein